MGHWIESEDSLKKLLEIEHDSIFDHVGDSMPPGRTKWIYQVGVVS